MSKTTELEIFSERTLKNGGGWRLLESSPKCSLYKTYDAYESKYNYFRTPPVFQVFDSRGKRLFAGESYYGALTYYEEVKNGFFKI